MATLIFKETVGEGLTCHIFIFSVKAKCYCETFLLKTVSESSRESSRMDLFICVYCNYIFRLFFHFLFVDLTGDFYCRPGNVDLV